jgi:hypothetical protein
MDFARSDFRLEVLLLSSFCLKCCCRAPSVSNPWLLRRSSECANFSMSKPRSSLHFVTKACRDQGVTRVGCPRRPPLASIDPHWHPTEDAKSIVKLVVSALAPIGSHWPPLIPISLHWLPLAPIGPVVPISSIGARWSPLGPVGFHWPPLAPIGSHRPPSASIDIRKVSESRI